MIALLATAAASLVAAVGVPVEPRGAPEDAAPAPWRDRPIAWALAGVSRDGRALLVQPGLWGGCDQGPPRVRATETASEIAIEVVVREPEGVEAMICPAIAGLSPRVRVALRAPVDGRRVTGPLRDGAPGAALPQTPERRPAVPRVVGLAARDARAALCGMLVRARGATGDRVVTGQSVRPGTPLPAGGAAPERCADLPAAPAVRLRAGR